MNKALLRTGGILAAFIIGYFLPQLKSLEWMIRWLIVLMLFTTFLKVSFREMKIQRKHLVVLSANVILAMVLWGVFKVAGYGNLAVMAFFVAITPTASAAPVIMGFLKGNVEFMITMVVVSTVGIGCVLPLLMPVAIGHSAPGLIGDMILSVATLLLLPLALALIVRTFYSGTQKMAVFLGKFQFPLWVVNLTLVSASGSAFIRQHDEITAEVFIEIAVLSAAICAINFGLGYLIGRPNLKRECSQSLGQKNTALTIYLALTYATPLAALAVTFYVVYHNIWNAVQIQRQGKKDRLSAALIQKEVDVVYSNEN